jgi:acetamidase/formamidase
MRNWIQVFLTVAISGGVAQIADPHASCGDGSVFQSFAIGAAIGLVSMLQKPPWLK